VSIESGKDAVRHFLHLKNIPDAFFAVEDFTALGVLKELKDRNYNIPADFGVMGFANELFGEHISPSLSTMDQQTVQMGKEAFNLLMQQIDHNGVNGFKQRKVVLDPVPVFRASSLKV